MSINQQKYLCTTVIIYGVSTKHSGNSVRFMSHWLEYMRKSLTTCKGHVLAGGLLWVCPKNHQIFSTQWTKSALALSPCLNLKQMLLNTGLEKYWCTCNKQLAVTISARWGVWSWACQIVIDCTGRSSQLGVSWVQLPTAADIFTFLYTFLLQNI